VSTASIALPTRARACIRVLRRRFVLFMLLAVALFALYMLWFRDSSLVAVKSVKVEGTGSGAVERRHELVLHLHGLHREQDLAGLDGHARQVGYALHGLPASTKVPWHRVINARGEVSARSGGDSHELQRHLLEAEGVAFDERGRVDLARYRWRKSRMQNVQC